MAMQQNIKNLIVKTLKSSITVKELIVTSALDDTSLRAIGKNRHGDFSVVDATTQRLYLHRSFKSLPEALTFAYKANKVF